MKAITLTQPWATLMMAPSIYTGVPPKRIESRSWPPSSRCEYDPMAEHGTRIGLHAGKGIDVALRRSIIVRGPFSEEFVRPYSDALGACGYSFLNPWSKTYAEDVRADNALRAAEGRPIGRLLPLGALLGFLTLDRVVSGAEVSAMAQRREVSEREYSLGSYDETHERRWGWITSNATALPEPIPMRGYQKLWDLPPEILRQFAL